MSNLGIFLLAATVWIAAWAWAYFIWHPEICSICHHLRDAHEATTHLRSGRVYAWCRKCKEFCGEAT